MHDTTSKPAPSSSRSLPPLRPDSMDRGRPKTRVTDPDSHARSHKTAQPSVSLPPIRPATRGSRDEEHGPLPGISSIISQADANKHFDAPVPRRPSEPSQRVYFNSPVRNQNGGRRAGSANQSQSTITQHRRSQDSIGTLGTDGSRQSSPETPSALSSSFASIKTASSLSSILEDRSACSSPPPILPSFAHLDGALPPNTLPPIGSAHVSPRSSVFELSDLRTHLPVDDSTVRARPNPRARASVGSPKSTPLPLSRPMSPSGHASSASFSGSSNNQRFNFKPAVVEPEGQAPRHKKAMSQDKIVTNKKGLFANEIPLNKKAPAHKGDDDTHSLGHHGRKHDQPATGGGSPTISPIKIEPGLLDGPGSPATKGSKDAFDVFIPRFTRTSDGSISDRPRGLHVNTDYDQDDTMSSCTPTQTLLHSSQLPREHSPPSAIDSSPVTATTTEPHTPVMRGHSPHPEPSPLTATTSSSSTSSHSDSGPISPSTVMSDPEEEDTKHGIVKDSELGGDQPLSAGARYNERRAKRREDAGAIDAASVQTRGGHFDFGLYGSSGFAPMGMGMGTGMGTGMGGMGMGMGMSMNAGMGMNPGMGMSSGMGMNTGMGLNAGMGMGTGMGIGPGMNMGHTSPMSTTPNPMQMHSMPHLNLLQQHAHQMGYSLQPHNDQGGFHRSTVSPMSGRASTSHMIRQQLQQQMQQRAEAIERLKQEQEKAVVEFQNSLMYDIPVPEPPMHDQTAPNFSHLMTSLQSLQTIPQDETQFMQPSIPQDHFDPLTIDPLPPYNNDDLLNLGADMHTGLVPPVPVSAPANEVLVAPLTGGASYVSQQQQSQQQRQQHTPAPSPPNPVVFRTPTETTTGKEEDNTSNSGSGSGAHKCEVCGKKFRRPSGLKDHKNIHSGDKPYCCPLETCRKGFATRSNMIRHHNKTHPSRPKIGGVADIGAEPEEIDVGEHEASPAASTGSGGSGGAPTQNRFRVVQQNIGGMDVGGVGPSRGNKDRRAIRKGHPTALVA
ncbi:hypothetical protein FRC12_003944 [Ceratobasidium sp. 428]|nr:hypothetical protein FRC12_003944 [Ceratobasidium sp. 428]